MYNDNDSQMELQLTSYNHELDAISCQLGDNNITKHIFSFIDDGRTYKNVLETCKSFYFLCKDKKREPSFRNELLTLLLMFPEKPWDWKVISRNPCFSLNFVEKHLEFMPKVCWEGMSQNPSFTMPLIMKYYEHINWKFLSHNPNITIDFVLDRPELMDEWNWNGLSQNSSVTMEFITSHPELMERWEWAYVSCNPNLTMEFVVSHPELNWGWMMLSYYNCTPEFVINHPEYIDKLHWQSIFTNSNFTTDFIVNYPEFVTVRGRACFAHNSNCTLEYISNHPEVNWSWRPIACKMSLTTKFITDNLHNFTDKWAQFHIFQNPAIPLEFSTTCFEYDPSTASGFSSNPKLTIEFIINHPEIKWECSKISNNLFHKYKRTELTTLSYK